MFNLWKKVEEKGAVAIPTRATALTPLEWAEVEEVYPELVPEEFRRYDIYADSNLLYQTPFERRKQENGGPEYWFRISVPNSNIEFSGAIDYRPLIKAMAVNDSDEYILTCACSEPGCAGFWEEHCHVSTRMIHLSIQKYSDKVELFFERERFEKHVLEMLKDLLDHKAGWDNLVCPSYSCFDSFAGHVEWLLEQRSYFRDMWSELDEE